MKIFLLGMLVMYLIISEILVNSERFDWGIEVSDGILAWVLVLPQMCFYHLGGLIYNKIKYYNIKSVVFIPKYKSWFYCERKDYDALDNMFLSEYSFEYKNKQKEIFYNAHEKEFEEFFSHKIYQYAKPNNDRYFFNVRYVPKSIWQNMKRVAICVPDGKNANCLIVDEFVDMEIPKRR